MPAKPTVIEFKVKLDRNDVRLFLERNGYNANEAALLAHTKLEENVQKRNTILRAAILRFLGGRK